MGRYDLLTHLEDEKEKSSQVRPLSSPTSIKSENTTPVKEEIETSLLANSQTNKLANQQTAKPTNLQTTLEANKFASKLANQQTNKSSLSTKEKKKYGTYLRPDSIYAIKVQALQDGRDSHEIVQEIIDLYYKNRKK
jgi:hypothetical protein